MQAGTSPERFRRDFAFRGLVLGAGSFIPGVGGLVVLSALQRFGEEVTASYGFALSVYGLVAVLCSGHGIAAVARLSRSIAAGESTSRQRLVFAELVATALAATATLIILAALVGTVVLVSGDVDKPTFVAAYSSLLIGSFPFPVGQVIAGWQQVRGEDVRMVQYTVESTVISVGISLLIASVCPDPLVVVASCGIVNGLGSLVAVVRSCRRLRPVARGTLKLGWSWLRARPRDAFAGVPRVGAASWDGIVLASTFALTIQIAISVDAATGATTAILVATLRTLIIPIKTVGILAGRLTRLRAVNPQNEPKLLRSLTFIMCLATTPIGILMIAMPKQVAEVLGIPSSAGADLAIALAGTQILLEPAIGFASAALKVLIRPSTMLVPLAVTLWGITLPLMLGLHWLGALSIVSLWAVLLSARVTFGLLVILRARRWGIAATNNAAVLHAR